MLQAAETLLDTALHLSAMLCTTEFNAGEPTIVLFALLTFAFLSVTNHSACWTIHINPAQLYKLSCLVAAYIPESEFLSYKY